MDSPFYMRLLFLLIIFSQFFYFYRMKQILLASLLISLSFLSFCQNKKANETKVDNEKKMDSLPAYAKQPLPNFRILVSVKGKDSVWFSNDDLPKNRPIAIIYFSPECGHCQFEMKEIEKNMDSLKEIFFVFASFHPLDSLYSFEKKYNTANYPNIVMGRDTKYFFPVYFSVKFTPFFALFDSKMKFVKSYDQGVKMPELIKIVNELPIEKIIDKKSKKKSATN